MSITSDSTSTLAAALDYRARGFSVMPVPRPIPGTPANTPGDGKTPAIRWKQYQTVRAGEAQLEQMFSTPQNIAIITGHVSGIVGLDADAPEAMRWITRHVPYSPWQSRTRKGFHVLLRHPGQRVPNKARLHTADGRIAVDIRGDGGYLIAPPSLHMSGYIYERAGDWEAPLDAVPYFDLAWLPARPSLSTFDNEPPKARRSTSAAPVVERARKYLQAIPRPEIGAGSDAATLYAACRLRRGFDLDECTVIDLLDQWAGGRIGWDRQWLAAKVAHASRYGSEPIGGLR